MNLRSFLLHVEKIIIALRPRLVKTASHMTPKSYERLHEKVAVTVIQWQV